MDDESGAATANRRMGWLAPRPSPRRIDPLEPMAYRFSIRQSLMAGARFIPQAWRGASDALGLTILAAIAFHYFSQQARSDVALARPSLLALVVLGVVTQGALYRLALGLDGAGPGGLQWRWSETRLMATSALSLVFLCIVGSLITVACLSLAYGVASAGSGFVASDPRSWPGAVHGAGRLAAGLGALLGVALMLWVLARVALASAATMARRKIQVLSIWPLTRNVAWRVAGSMVLVFGAATAVSYLIGRTLAAWPQNLALALLWQGLWLPMHVGLMSSLYASLSQPET